MGAFKNRASNISSIYTPLYKSKKLKNAFSVFPALVQIRVCSRCSVGVGLYEKRVALEGDSVRRVAGKVLEELGAHHGGVDKVSCMATFHFQSVNQMET
jgi:hypothetical protein